MIIESVKEIRQKIHSAARFVVWTSEALYVFGETGIRMVSEGNFVIWHNYSESTQVYKRNNIKSIVYETRNIERPKANIIMQTGLQFPDISYVKFPVK